MPLSESRDCLVFPGILGCILGLGVALWVASRDNPRTVWYSQELWDGHRVRLPGQSMALSVLVEHLQTIPLYPKYARNFRNIWTCLGVFAHGCISCLAFYSSPSRSISAPYLAWRSIELPLAAYLAWRSIALPLTAYLLLILPGVL